MGYFMVTSGIFFESRISVKKIICGFIITNHNRFQPICQTIAEIYPRFLIINKTQIIRGGIFAIVQTEVLMN